MKRRIAQQRRGSNLVEFALILPVFLTVIFGIIEFGWFFYQHTAVINGTRDGCREGALYRANDPINPADVVAANTIFNNLMAGGVDCATPGRCTIDCNPVGAGDTLSLQCDVQVQYTPIIGFVPVVPSSHNTTSVNILELR